MRHPFAGRTGDSRIPRAIERRTGTLAPGTLSQPMTIDAGNRSDHCTMHPTMVGTVVVSSASE